MNKIYVTGHRNPDTDSVVSAMAYAALRNATGDREYVAARLGHLSDETKLILNRFGFEPPLFIKNMRTQVMDLDFDTPPILNRAVTVNRAWSAMEEDKHISAIPRHRRRRPPAGDAHRRGHRRLRHAHHRRPHAAGGAPVQHPQRPGRASSSATPTR